MTHSTTLKLRTPPPVAEPRGAVLVGELFGVAARLQRGARSLGRGLWQVLLEQGQQRAQRELRRLARLHADDPRLGPVLREAAYPRAGAPAPAALPTAPEQRAAEEAAAVRAIALRYAETDRGHARDLLAAADRHEALAEAHSRLETAAA